MISFTVDTNILIYAVDVDAGPKHAIASRILGVMARRSAPIPLQALSEFYQATTKKRILTGVQAGFTVQRLRESLRVAPYGIEDLQAAIQIHQEHGTQAFDALLLATAIRLGCRTFITEDMQDGRSIYGITIRNPFVCSAEELDELLS